MTTKINQTLSEILKQFGLTDAKTQDTLENYAKNLLKEKYPVNILGIKHKTLVVKTDTQNAKLLQYDTDNLIEKIDTKFPGEITAIRIHTF